MRQSKSTEAYHRLKEANREFCLAVQEEEGSDWTRTAGFGMVRAMHNMGVFDYDVGDWLGLRNAIREAVRVYYPTLD